MHSPGNRELPDDKMAASQNSLEGGPFLFQNQQKLDHFYINQVREINSLRFAHDIHSHQKVSTCLIML